MRVVPASSGTFWGVSIGAADIGTVAGDGKAYTGTGLATKTGLDFPWGVAVGANGNLLVANVNLGRIFSVAG